MQQTSHSEKINLKGLDISELEAICSELGIEKFRAKQLFKWIYKKQARSFEEMTDLNKELRARLDKVATLQTITLSHTSHSEDGTIKFLFRLFDGREIETVLIPSELRDETGEAKRLTLCVSTQVGCPVNCKFCATATLKLKRNLTAGEIVDQFLQAQLHVSKPITNLVFMGMGEPMLNYENVMKSADIFTHPDSELLSAKRITLSTSGFVDGIKRMADEKRQIKLALSLHATTNTLRTSLMPINKKFDLRALGDAIEYYYRKTKIPITYEYILFDGLNDSFDDAKRLAKFTKRVDSKVNVIPFHPIDFTSPQGLSADLQPTSSEKFEEFLTWLRELGAMVMVRSSSGKDINGACGQLALSVISE